jgi:hypothetical protein
MKRYIAITLLFAITSSITFCQALHLDKNWWHDFNGKLGQTEVQLSIYLLDSGHLKGNYCYKKYENKILLTGQLTGDKIELTGFINGKINEHFSGRIFTDSLDRFEGVWNDSSGKKVASFKLTLTSASYASNWEHRYSDYSWTDNDVENFMKRVRNSILTNNKEWIADHIAYPLTTTLNGKTHIKIKDRNQLINNFNKIFHQAFMER